VVAQQFDDIEHSQHILKVTVLATYPLLLAVLAAIAWRVVGAALRPVEVLRSSAERISGTGQDTRLPVSSSGDEIHALGVTLNSMLDRLAAARARQRAFVADAAHELRSPLASMQTQLEVAQRLGESTPSTDDLHAEVLRMTSLVEDLLMLARLDADTAPTPTPQSIDVRALVEHVAGRYADARVPVSIGAMGHHVVRGQPDELRRALANLVDNAVRHASTAVEIRAYEDGPNLTVAVSDDGAGIPAAEHERVFERFTRLDEARDRDAGGSGLGLSIVRELVSRSDGSVRIGASSRPGLTVEVRLPRA
jgi:signal transduction histidine kinase